jgi:hypothetical protein
VRAPHKPLNRPPTYALSVDIGVCVDDLWKLWGDAPSCRTSKGDIITGAVTGAARRAKTGQGDSRIEKQLSGAGESRA